MDIQLDKAPCGYFSISDAGIIQSVNQTLLDMLLYERDQLLGWPIEMTMSVTNKLFFHTYFYPYIQLYGHVDEMYFSFRTSDRQDVPVLLNGVRQERNGETVIDCVVLMMRKRIEHERDILQTKTKLQELYQATNEANQKLERLHEEYEIKQQELVRINLQLETMASTDPLTGLKNRRYFQDQLLASLASFHESGISFRCLSLILIVSKVLTILMVIRWAIWCLRIWQNYCNPCHGRWILSLVMVARSLSLFFRATIKRKPFVRQKNIVP